MSNNEVEPDPYPFVSPSKMAHKYAAVAENLYTRQALDTPFFQAAVAMANMWAAVAQAGTAAHALSKIMETDPQTGAPDKP